MVGCQRSGTSMLVEALGASPSVWPHSEGTNRAFVDYRLREADRIAHLIRRGPAPVVAFKPICDSHLTDVLLDQHHGSRAVWIWRDHRDVSRSAITRWGDHQMDVIARLRAGRFEDLGWRGERVPAGLVDELRAMPLAGPEDGAVLLWYLRNSFLLSLRLDHDPRVLIVRYEDLVADPGGVLGDVFGHIDVAVPDAAVAQIRRSEREPAPLEGASTAVTELALDLTDRLAAVTSSHRRG